MSKGSRQAHATPRRETPAPVFVEGRERYLKRMGFKFSVEEAERCVSCTVGFIYDYPEDARVECEAIRTQPCPFHGSVQP